MRMYHEIWYSFEACATVITARTGMYSLRRFILDEQLLNAANPDDVVEDTYHYLVHKWNAEGPFRIEAIEWVTGWLIFKEGTVPQWMIDLVTEMGGGRIICEVGQQR